MVFRAGHVLLAVGALIPAWAPVDAQASTASYGFQGTVAVTDDFLGLFQLTTTEDSQDVFLATLSNGGGVFYPAAAPYGGVTSASRGFQTDLFLFTAAGLPSGTAKACGDGGPLPDPTTWGHFDSNDSVEIPSVDGATQRPEPGGFGLFGGGRASIGPAFFPRKRVGRRRQATC